MKKFLPRKQMIHVTLGFNVFLKLTKFLPLVLADLLLTPTNVFSPNASSMGDPGGRYLQHAIVFVLDLGIVET